MEQDRYDELLNTLRRWRDRFADNLIRQIESSINHSKNANSIYASEGVGEDFGPWLDRFCRQLAIQFILRVLFIRVLEDRGLLEARRIRSRDSQQLFEALAPHLGVTSYLRFVFRDVAQLLPDLFEESSQDIVWPEDTLSNEFLEEVWRRPDVEREGRLRYDFRGNGDGGFDTRFIGDLYQDIDAEAREYFALLQTPEFISQFILKHTLLELFEEKDFREIQLLDPTCGSGHFLVDAFYQFANRYLESGESGESSKEKSKIARRILKNQIFGADINPYACALAKFRLILAACDFSHPTNLEDYRSQILNIVCCDSLIPYEDPDTMRTQVEIGDTSSKIEQVKQERFGSISTAIEAKSLFSKDFDVVVGNPPYISVKDPVKRDLYREFYKAAYGKYGLAAPFIERFLLLSGEKKGDSKIGLIVSNSFATRQFGKALIEKVIPEYELVSVIDLSGVYIPGHGTPTTILFFRNNAPINSTIQVVSNLRGETGEPADPSNAELWKSVTKGFEFGHGYQDRNVDVFDISRTEMYQHPWSFGGPTQRLYKTINDRCIRTLGDVSEAIGVLLMTNADEVFVMPVDYARRLGLKLIKPFVLGENIRDWQLRLNEYSLFPYNEKLELVNIDDYENEYKYLSRYKEILENRAVFGGGTYKSEARPWYEYHQISFDRLRDPSKLIAFAFIATHNHFSFPGEMRVLNRSVQVVQSISSSLEDVVGLCALLNSSLISLCLKEFSYNKGAGQDPVRDRYELSAKTMDSLPVPDGFIGGQIDQRGLKALAVEMNELANQSISFRVARIFKKSAEAYQNYYSSHENRSIENCPWSADFQTVDDLQTNLSLELSAHIKSRQRMIFIQEEMDWGFYELYGLLEKAPMGRNYLTAKEYSEAKLELGQRAFERSGNGYKGDWPKSWIQNQRGNLPGTKAELPELSKNVKRLIQDRINLINSNENIALLEDPLYKRRWIPPDYEIEFREALKWWIRENAEWELEKAGKPLHIKGWSHRLMAHDRVRAALEVYSNTPSYDPISTIETIITPKAVPNRPEHYLSTSGLRKLARGEIEYMRADFSDANAWKVRGKLNIPRERYIAYKEFEPGWYGWAGWDAEKRAEALVYLLEQAAVEGWPIHHRQCGLRASLRDLVPELSELPEGDKQEFETIAYLCGIREQCFCTPFREAEPSDRPPGFDEPSIRQQVKDDGGPQISLF